MKKKTVKIHQLIILSSIAQYRLFTRFTYFDSVRMSDFLFFPVNRDFNFPSFD